jgi:hypothetical protein
MPRAKGNEALAELLTGDPSNVVFGGTVVGDAIDIESANLFIGFRQNSPVDVSEVTVLLAQLCQRLSDLQFYDGPGRVDRFEKDAEGEGAVSDTFLNTIGGMGRAS